MMVYVLCVCEEGNPEAVPLLCNSPECPIQTLVCTDVSDRLAQEIFINDYAHKNKVSVRNLVFMPYKRR